MSRILLIEDSTDLASGLKYNLELEGYDVRVAEDGESGLALARSWHPDLLILDLMLPGLDGFQVLHALRGEGKQLPVLILSARGEESDKVRGFRLDADQYVTKPFGLLELLERVRSLLRKSRARTGDTPAPSDAKRGDTIRFGEVEIDPASHAVTVGGEAATLTPKAFELMMALIRRDGAVATRVELLREVWEHRALVLTRTVDSHMAEVRRKVERDPANPRHFLTVWKVGYRFRP